MKTAASLIVALLVSGCVAPGIDSDSPTPDPDELTLGGRYDVDSIWDLSSMVTGEALGAAARQLVVELAVDALGVPSLVRDEAIAEVDDLVGATIETEVTELAASSQSLAELGADLGFTEVVSVWTIEGGAGRERLISMAVETNGVAFSASLDGLDPLAEIGGPLEISGSGAERAVETYELAFGAGSLIRPAAEAAVAASLAPLSCDAIAALVVGADGELVIGIDLVSYTITADDVAALCADQIDSLAADLLGMLDYGIAIELGGPIAIADDDGDAVADRIDSLDGYAGALLGLPLPMAVSLAARLQ